MQRYETNLAIVPKELAGSTPRKVRISSSGIRVAIGSGLLLFIGVCIATWATISVVRQMQTRDALRHDGTESIGEVIRKERYIVYYTFIASGSTYSGHARATPRERANLSVGSAIPVRFLSSNPDVNHPANWEWSIFLDLETLMAPLLPGGLGFAFLIVRPGIAL